MLDFLNDNYRSWDKVIGHGKSHFDEPGRKVFDYGESDGRACSVGTEYYAHLHGWERGYIHSMIRWVALKIGRVRVKFARSVVGATPVAKPLPFLVYDSYEFWPIIVTTPAGAAKIPKKRQWCAVDNVGCYLGAEFNSAVVMDTTDWLYTNKEAYEAFNADQAKLGLTLADKPNDSVSHRAWLDRLEELKVKHCKPEIDRTLPVLRAELVRLDGLWSERCSSAMRA